MKKFLKFLTKLKGFWKIYSGYGYDGETVEFILGNYQEVLDIRAYSISVMCNAIDVIREMDKFYENLEELKNESPRYNEEKIKEYERKQ